MMTQSFQVYGPHGSAKNQTAQDRSRIRSDVKPLMSVVRMTLGRFYSMLILTYGPSLLYKS